MAKSTQHDKSLADFFGNEEDDNFFSNEIADKKKEKPATNKTPSEKDEDEEDVDKDEDTEDESEEQDDDWSFEDSTDDDEDDKDDNDDEKKVDKKKPADAKDAKKDVKEKVKKTEDADDDNEDDTDPKFYTTLAKQFKEKGVFGTVEVDEDAEYTEDEFIELQDEELENRVEERINTITKGNSQEAIDLLKFLNQGGQVRSFIQVYAQPTFPEDMDLTVKKNQTQILKTYLREIEEMDDEDLEDRLKWMEEGARAEKYVKKYHEFFVTQEKANKQRLIDNQRKAKQKSIEDARLFKEGVADTLSKTDEVYGFSLSRKKKEQINEFITDASTKTKEGFKTKLQLKLAEVFRDNKKLVALANILMTDFDFKDIKVKGASEKVKGIKEKLNLDKQGHKKGSATRFTKTKTLADLLD